MSDPFWKSPVYGVIKAIMNPGNGPGIVYEWIKLSHQWALDHPTKPDAQALLTWVPQIQFRPFYTANELTPMFPGIMRALELSNDPPKYSGRQLALLLDRGRLPVCLNKDEASWFRDPKNGKVARFYICDRVRYWRQRRLTQEEFEHAYYN